jgi:hypothetical protein
VDGEGKSSGIEKLRRGGWDVEQVCLCLCGYNTLYGCVSGSPDTKDTG